MYMTLKLKGCNKISGFISTLLHSWWVISITEMVSPFLALAVSGEGSYTIQQSYTHEGSVKKTKLIYKSSNLWQNT